MCASYKGGAADALARMPLGKVPLTVPKPKVQNTSRLERIIHEQNDQLAQLQTEIIDLRLKNSELERQVEEMTDFLADYGLQWVGGPAPKDMSYDKGPQDMETFLARISELNRLAERAGGSIESNGHCGKFAPARSIKIELLSDGFTLDGGPLRLYTQPLSAAFFRDIMDGYFPSEFKTDYPEGIVLMVEDKRTVDFTGRCRRLIDTPISEIRKSDSRVSARSPEGDGIIRIRIPGQPAGSISVDSSTKIRAIRREAKRLVGGDSFEVCDAITGKPFDDDATVKELGLYPKGIVLICNQS